MKAWGQYCILANKAATCDDSNKKWKLASILTARLLIQLLANGLGKAVGDGTRLHHRTHVRDLVVSWLWLWSGPALTIAAIGK